MKVRVRRSAALVVVAVATVFGALGGHSGARAAAPSRTGWWKVGLPTADVAIGGVGNLKDPQGADVPDGGLLVQGGASPAQPAAYAALGFDLGAATITGPLKLVPAANTVSVPNSKLIACPLVNPSFVQANGGSLTEGPSYSCASAVSATVDSAGAYVFDVAGLRQGDTLAVAIVPTAPTDRVVFSRPGDTALPVDESASTPDAALTSPQPDAGVGSSDVPAPLSSDAGGIAASPAIPPTGEAAPVATAPGSAAPVLPAAQPAAATHSSPSSRVLYVIIPLLALAGVLWLGSGQPS